MERYERFQQSKYLSEYMRFSFGYLYWFIWERQEYRICWHKFHSKIRNGTLRRAFTSNSHNRTVAPTKIGAVMRPWLRKLGMDSESGLAARGLSHSSRFTACRRCKEPILFLNSAKLYDGRPGRLGPTRKLAAAQQRLEQFHVPSESRPSEQPDIPGRGSYNRLSPAINHQPAASSGHVATRSLSPQHLRSPMLT